MTALSNEHKFLLNNRMGKVASVTQLGTRLQEALAGQLPNGSVSLAELASGVAPSHVAKFAGKHTTVGGDATEVIAVAGLLVSDIAVVTVQTAGGTPRSIVASVLTADTITVTMSGDPAADHVLSYVVFRAAA